MPGDNRSFSPETYERALQEWDWLRGWCAFEAFAARMGMSHRQWERIYAEGVRRGDSRARRPFIREVAA